MLGTNTSNSYTNINQFNSAADYLSYMFDGMEGLVTRSTINLQYKEAFYRGKGIVRAAYDTLENVYVSMNTFYRNQRQVTAIKRLNACYVDIDCYHLGLTKEAVLFELEQDYFNTKIPTPTFVIDSGRGLYLIWKLKNEDKNALPRWQTVQNHLQQTCKELGADPVCTDGARILRVPFTRNSKSASAVKILRFNDLAYTIYEITNEFDIKQSRDESITNKTVYAYGQATEQMRQYADMISKQNNLELPNYEDYKETFDYIKQNTHTSNKKRSDVRCYNTKNIKYILKGRCEDLEQLYKQRKGENCKRETALFLYRLWMIEITGSFTKALEKTLVFNKKLDCPFTEKYVKSQTKSAEKKIKRGQTYKYSKKRIIQALEIKNDEMETLTYLKNTTDRKACNHKSYLLRIKKDGKTTKKENIEQRQKKIVKMQKKGIETKEICKKLKISRATYNRDIVCIKTKQKNQSRVKKTITKTIGIVKRAEDQTNAVKPRKSVSFFKLPYYGRSLLLRFLFPNSS